MTTDTLPPLLQALLNPQCYAHPTQAISLLETHISWVILTGEYAYKVKKPVDLGFVDFSTLEKRKQFCLEELRLNRRLAPDLYLDVVAIEPQSETFKIVDQSPSAVEFAVRMRQFPQQQLLANCLQRHEISPPQIQQFAKRIADFHQQIANSPPDHDYGSYHCVKQVIEENFQHIKSYQHSSELEQQRQASLAQLQQQQPLIQQRQQQGFVRECHGDLHLANLVVLNQQITPFDCIEFNPSLYWIDVISEVAFLIMDLQQRGYGDFANQFLNHYLAQTGDYAGVVLLPLYLNYRAMVRAKISAIRLQQQLAASEQLAEQQQLTSYLALAKHYCQPSHGALIITHGLSGSGKSWLCQQLAAPLNAIHIRSDVERKRLFSGDSSQPLYGAAATQATYQHLCDLAESLICTGETVLIDATCLHPWQRSLFQQMAQRQQLPCLILQLQTPPAQLEANIRQRQQQHDPSDADLAVLAKQLTDYQPIAPAVELVDHHWQSDIKLTLQAIQQKLARKS